NVTQSDNRVPNQGLTSLQVSSVLLDSIDRRPGSLLSVAGWILRICLFVQREGWLAAKEKGTGIIRCLLAPQVVSSEHRCWVMLISMSRSKSNGRAVTLV